MKKILLTLSIIVTALISTNGQGRYVADTGLSKITWTGTKIVGGGHTGVISLKEGWLTMQSNKIMSGEFIVDMTTIQNSDIKDEKMRETLVGHLKSDDFFGVEKYPLSKLVIISQALFVNGTATVKGDLTIKGITLPVEFQVTLTENPQNLTFKSQIAVDRAKYNIRYGSGTFFSNLGDKAIDDIFTLDVLLVVSK